MKKEQYDDPIIDIFCFKRKDVIRTSDNWTEDIMPTGESDENY